MTAKVETKLNEIENAEIGVARMCSRETEL